jgi:5-methylcytosine-specific restriction endonuclease McrA
MSALTAPVLVLNKNWSALRVVPAHRAISYLAKGAAEAIDTETHGFPTHCITSWQELSELRAKFEPDQHDFIKTVRSVIAVPQVIRLMKFGRMQPQRVRFNRRNIYGRDNNTCQYCGKRFTTQDLNLDHVIPRSRGGQSTWENIVCSCIPCNTRKADRTPQEAGMRLVREPRRLAVPFDTKAVRHKSWEHFVDSAYWTVELQK